VVAPNIFRKFRISSYFCNLEKRVLSLSRLITRGWGIKKMEDWEKGDLADGGLADAGIADGGFRGWEIQQI
jgi:hypothetical protein